MQRMKASIWRLRYFAAEGRPSETWLTKQLRLGEIPGEKIGGCWFVWVKNGTIEPDYGRTPARDNAQAQADALLEDWMHAS